MYSLLTHIATGLEYLHGLNIIHGGALAADVATQRGAHSS